MVCRSWEKVLRTAKGEIKLIPEILEDLWHLRFAIEKGDTFFPLTKSASDSDDKLGLIRSGFQFGIRFRRNSR